MTKINRSIKMDDTILLLQNGFVDMQSGAGREDNHIAIGTIISNMAYFGFAPSKAVVDAMTSLSEQELEMVWAKLSKALKYVTAADRKMGKFVVYKNFPQEVLSMSQAEYWINQIFMYLGLPNDLFTEEEQQRESVYEKIDPRILDLADDSTRLKIYKRLKSQPAEWTVFQKAQATLLSDSLDSGGLDLDDFTHKSNGVELIASAWPDILNGSRTVSVSTATDVMRIAAALSGVDVSLRKKEKFRKFSRPERRLLVSLLDGAKHIESDFALRTEQWKRLLSFLKPGEFKYDKVKSAYDKLYRSKLRADGSPIELGLLHKDVSVFEALRARPGEFLRRLHKTYAVFGRVAFENFLTIMDKLTVSQLLKLDGYLSTANTRSHYLVTPRGSWSKAKILQNDKVKLSEEDLSFIRKAISAEVGKRLRDLYPEGFVVDPRTALVKLQSNGQELAPYGRGTVLEIPDNITFIRTASYWENKSNRNTWFDNGFNFFDEKWEHKGAICWDSVAPFSQDEEDDDVDPDDIGVIDYSADRPCVFSGDPTNVKELNGRACQMIDLYPKKLMAEGVRYAVWSILSYNALPFSNAEEVVATLQWGGDEEANGLFEPSRAQMVFPISGNELTKVVAYIDFVENKLIYLDAGFVSKISSAKQNQSGLAEKMPVILEHLNSIPSIADLFGHAASDGGVPVLFDDKDVDIDGEVYVFKRLNDKNDAPQIDVENILAVKSV